MDDYISRQAAINIACGDECEDCPDGGCDMYRRLKRLPAADVRPVVRAKWEDKTGFVFNVLAQRVYCPNCKSYAYFYPITTKNYCPNCGADMWGEGTDFSAPLKMTTGEGNEDADE